LNKYLSNRVFLLPLHSLLLENAVKWPHKEVVDRNP